MILLIGIIASFDGLFRFHHRFYGDYAYPVIRWGESHIPGVTNDFSALGARICTIFTISGVYTFPMQVVAFNGSPRKGGNTERLLGYVTEVLHDEGIDTEVIQIGGKSLQGCTACGTCYDHLDRRCSIDTDIVNYCIERMADADGMLIGSPTYFADISPETKALIDRAGFVGMANGGLYARKVGAAVVAVRRAGGIHAFDTINHFFGISNMFTVGSSYWNLGLGLNPGDVDTDEEGIRTMRTLGANMAWLLQTIHKK
jgi:multimeric flavodoxin WrbA